jgi:hypothetical protein
MTDWPEPHDLTYFACCNGAWGWAHDAYPDERQKVARQLRKDGVLVGEFASLNEASAAVRAALTSALPSNKRERRAFVAALRDEEEEEVRTLLERLQQQAKQSMEAYAMRLAEKSCGCSTGAYSECWFASSNTARSKGRHARGQLEGTVVV